MLEGEPAPAWTPPAAPLGAHSPGSGTMCRGARCHPSVYVYVGVLVVCDVSTVTHLYIAYRCTQICNSIYLLMCISAWFVQIYKNGSSPLSIPPARTFTAPPPCLHAAAFAVSPARGEGQQALPGEGLCGVPPPRGSRCPPIFSSLTPIPGKGTDAACRGCRAERWKEGWW